MHLSLPHTCYIHRQLYSPWNNIWWGVQIMMLSLCSLLHYPVTSFLLGTNAFLSNLFWTPSAHVLPLVWETKFHTHIQIQSCSSIYFNLYILNR
jgi:hypothetical protein